MVFLSIVGACNVHGYAFIREQTSTSQLCRNILLPSNNDDILCKTSWQKYDKDSTTLLLSSNNGVLLLDVQIPLTWQRLWPICNITQTLMYCSLYWIIDSLNYAQVPNTKEMHVDNQLFKWWQWPGISLLMRLFVHTLELVSVLFSAFCGHGQFCLYFLAVAQFFFKVVQSRGAPCLLPGWLKSVTAALSCSFD